MVGEKILQNEAQWQERIPTKVLATAVCGSAGQCQPDVLLSWEAGEEECQEIREAVL